MPKSTPTSSPKRRAKPLRKKQPTNTVKLATEVLPGYWRFSREAWELVWTHRQLFSRLVLIVWIGLSLVSLTAEQTQYASLSEATHEAVRGLPEGSYRALAATGVLFSSVLSGSLTSVLSEGQHVARAALYLMLWLVMVWLLRHLLTGSTMKVRDGLYNAGAPLIPVLLIVLLGMVQLLPLALTVSLFAALLTTGALSQTLIIGLMSIVSIALSVATLYWLSGTFFAAIIATIPGTYPVAALRSARAVITGYRGRVLLRMAWLGFVLLVAFTAVMLPILFIDGVFSITSPLLVASLSHLLSAVLAIYASTYVYLLYRKIIDGRTE